MDLCDRKVIKELMERAGIGFRHDLGQNFLINPEIPRRCAAECECDTDCLVLEIGPGIGCLTQELAKRFRHVAAIEIDQRLIPILAETLAGFDNVTVTCADVMKTDLAAFLSDIKRENGLPADGHVAVCANLPYYITTPILMYLLESGVRFSSVTIMVQAEVADRLTAAPGSEAYGAITAVLGYYGQTKRLFTVPAGCFVPAPKVNSAVVRLSLYDECPYRIDDKDLFFRTIKAAFEQRRKTLVNALAAGFPSLSKEALTEAVVFLGLDPRVRGERLSAERFAELSNLLAALLSAKKAAD